MNRPIITGATGLVTKNFKKFWKPYQENIQQIHYKRQLPGTSHIIPKILQPEIRSHSMEFTSGSRLLSLLQILFSVARLKILIVVTT
jgi:hypothetical protein